MADHKEQVKPLTPRTHPIDLEKYDDPFHKDYHPHRKYVKLCGCATAIILVTVVIVLVLIFTLFWAKSPVLRLNSMRIEGMEGINWRNVTPGTNLTIYADVNVKNRNMASFKYQQAVTSMFYDGSLIGEARIPGGSVRARRTKRVNVTIDVMVKNMVDVPRLNDDFVAGFMMMTSYTRIYGKVKIFNIIKRSVSLKTNCTMKVNFNTYMIEAHDCKRRITT